MEFTERHGGGQSAGKQMGRKATDTRIMSHDVTGTTNGGYFGDVVIDFTDRLAPLSEERHGAGKHTLVLTGVYDEKKGRVALSFPGRPYNSADDFVAKVDSQGSMDQNMRALAELGDRMELRCRTEKCLRSIDLAATYTMLAFAAHALVRGSEEARGAFLDAGRGTDLYTLEGAATSRKATAATAAFLRKARVYASHLDGKETWMDVPEENTITR